MEVQFKKSFIFVSNSNSFERMMLKFKIIDNKLYVFDMIWQTENQKELEVKKINDINIKDIIDIIEANDFSNIDKLISLGINPFSEYKLTLIEDGVEKVFDLYAKDMDMKFFYKKHEINSIIPDASEELMNLTEVTDNIMLEYASSNAKALLNILSNNLISIKDKELVEEVLDEFASVSDNYNNVVNNLDMIFLSTELLRVDHKLGPIPKGIEREINWLASFDFGDGILKDTNSSILTNNMIDYDKVVKMIRNSIAHSNYKVVDKDYLEFDDKNYMFYLKVPKSSITRLFKKLYDYYYLEGAIPIIFYEYRANFPNPMTKDELDKYLDSLEVFNLKNYDLKRFPTEKEQENMDDILSLEIDNIKLATHDNMYLNKIYKKPILDRFHRTIGPHLDYCIKDSEKLTEEDIIYIKSNIKELGEDYFYSLGSTSQISIINRLIYQRYNKDYYMYKNIEDIMKADYFSNDSLTNEADNYINYKAKLEVLITSFLNNLLVFCYNQNKSNIDVSNMLFPISVYKGYKKSKENLVKAKMDEVFDYCSVYESLIYEEDSKKSEINYFADKIESCKNKIIKYKNNIIGVNNIIKGNIVEENITFTNKDILNSMRNTLAHGDLEVNIKDINNILDTELHFINKYQGEVNFDSTITLKELLNTIKIREFIDSMLNNNKNFLNNKGV